MVGFQIMLVPDKCQSKLADRLIANNRNCSCKLQEVLSMIITINKNTATFELSKFFIFLF